MCEASVNDFVSPSAMVSMRSTIGLFAKQCDAKFVLKVMSFGQDVSGTVILHEYELKVRRVDSPFKQVLFSTPMVEHIAKPSLFSHV